MKTAKQIATLAVMAALMVAAKWALNVVPNVELVSLFAALFAYTFGFISIIPITIFCTEELISWGFGSWAVAYYIYFNLIAIVFALLSRRKKESIVLPIISITILTTFFGILTTAIDCLFTGLDNFFYKFSIIYARGIAFYIVHIISNIVIFSALFYPLKKLLLFFKEKIYK